MSLPLDFKALEEDLPKIAATSILIPILQWAVTQSWNYTRKARISALRKGISELNDFISKQNSYAGDPGVDQSIQIAQEERSRIIKRLNNSCGSEHAERRTLAAILLFDKPRSFQVLFARVVAYIVLVALLKDIYELYEHHGHHFDIPEALVYILVLLGFHRVARRANTITGEPNQRRWWQALTLLYRNSMRIGANLQGIFLVWAVLIVANVVSTIYNADSSGSPYDIEGIFIFILFGF